MRTQDRQKLRILVILLVVLGATLLLSYRLNRPSVTAAVQIPETKPSVNPPAPTDARIRLDLIEKPEDSADIGRKNVFQYEVAPPPASTAPHKGGSAGSARPLSPAVSVPQVNQAAAPTVPMGPPPMPFKYQGYALETVPAGQMVAFVTDDSTAHHYNVGIGEVLMGRYRVTQISAISIEVEDMQFNRRQTIPLIK